MAKPPNRTGKRGSTKRGKMKHKSTTITRGPYAGETGPGLPGKPRPNSSLALRDKVKYKNRPRRK